MEFEGAVAEVTPEISDVSTSDSGSSGTSGAEGSSEVLSNDTQTGEAVSSPEQQQPTEDQQQTDQTADDGDGRTVPTKWRELFRQDKELRNLFFASQRFRTEFPGGINEVTKYRDFYNNVGGEEGFRAVEAERQEWQALDEQFANGDPKFIENIATENPEGFGKLIPTALEQFAKLDRDGYNHVMSRVIVDTLQGAKLNEIYNALAANEQTKGLAQHLADFYNNLDNLARNVPVKKFDPEREKFEKEKNEFQQQKQKEFRESVASEMRTFNVRQIETSLTAEFKARGFDLGKMKTEDPEAYKILLNNCNGSIGQVLQQDKPFLQKYEAFLAAGDKKGALQFAQARIAKVAPDAVKKTYRAFTKLGGGQAAEIAKREATNAARKDLGPGAPAGSTKLPKPPDGSQIDWTRTTKDMVWNGEGFLKGRKDKVYF